MNSSVTYLSQEELKQRVHDACVASYQEGKSLKSHGEGSEGNFSYQ